MTDTASSLIQAAQHLEAAADILRRAARPDIQAPRDGQIEDFLASGHVKPGAWTPAHDIQARYEAWCHENVREPMHPNRLGRALTAAGIGSRRTTNGMRLRALALVPAPERSEHDS